jgi:hypothetical protein
MPSSDRVEGSGTNVSIDVIESIPIESTMAPPVNSGKLLMVIGSSSSRILISGSAERLEPSRNVIADVLPSDIKPFAIDTPSAGSNRRSAPPSAINCSTTIWETRRILLSWAEKPTKRKGWKTERGAVKLSRQILSLLVFEKDPGQQRATIRPGISASACGITNCTIPSPSESDTDRLPSGSGSLTTCQATCAVAPGKIDAVTTPALASDWMSRPKTPHSTAIFSSILIFATLSRPNEIAKGRAADGAQQRGDARTRAMIQSASCGASRLSGGLARMLNSTE